MALVSFDPSLLLSYYQAKLPPAASQIPASPLQNSTAQSQTVPPWSVSLPSQEVEDVAARSTDPYFDPNDTTLLSKADGTATSGTANASSELEALLNSTLSQNSSTATSNPGLAADNDKLFALYSALNRLDYIAQMATRDGTTAGQLPGLDASFQNGLNQISSFVQTTQFSNLTVMPGQKTATTQSTVSVAYPQFGYTGGAVTSDASVFDPVPGISASDSFTVEFTKAGVATDVPIDLSQVQGPLTIDNIDSYVNQQLQVAGSGTRFARVQTGGDIASGNATWGVQINNSPSETVSLSADGATPAIYVAGASGLTTDQDGKLVKLDGLSGTPATVFSTNIAPDSGTASAKATAVDAQGNVYVVGNSSGSFGNEVNQGAQDVFLRKYDSAGNLLWTKLLGSADSASAYSIATDPKSGGVVIAGQVTGDLSPSSIGGGNDSFVAKYDTDGNQVWVRQVAPLSDDQANSVSVDASGNVYVGGQTASTIAAGQTSSGGQDAYVTKLDPTGKVVYQRQFGTSGTDSAAKTAVADDGNLLVASVQSGHAILTKYNSADGASDPMWQIDLGDLQGGTIGGIASANGQVYLTGTSANAALDAGGTANVAHASSGGTDAFVFSATDAGATATPDFVSYVGTSASDQGGGVAVANGKIYVTGTTSGTFAGETRNQPSTHNLFVAQMDTDGTVDWTHQYGGLDGESTGAAIAADPSGSSVLDALKLPRGTIDTNQSNALASQTTVRAGDYFSLQIQDASGTRTAKVTIESDETMRSLALKINNALLFDGKATTLGVNGGQGLQISVNQGVQVSLIGGTKDLDALAGLGLKPQTLINDSSSGNTSSGNTSSPGNTSSSTSTSATPQVVGLGINGGINLLDSSSAQHADIVLQGALSLIKQTYNQLNNPPSASTTTQAAGPIPAYLQSQIAGYQTALAWLSSSSS